MQVIAIQKTVFPGVIAAALIGALIMSLAPAQFTSIISADRPAEPIAAYPAPEPLAPIQLTLDSHRIQQELDGIDELLPLARLSPAAEGRMIVSPAPQSIAGLATKATVERELEAYEKVRDRRHELVRQAELYVEQRHVSERHTRSAIRAAAPLSFPDHALAAGGQVVSAAAPRSIALNLADDTRGIAGVLRPVLSIAVPAGAFRFAVIAENTVDRDYHQLRNGYAGGYESIVSDLAVVLSSAPVSVSTVHDFQSFSIAASVILFPASVSVFGRTQPRLALSSLLVLSNAPPRRVRTHSFGEMI